MKLILLKLLGEYVTENYSRNLSFYDLKINIMLNFYRKKKVYGYSGFKIVLNFLIHKNIYLLPKKVLNSRYSFTVFV